MKELILCVLSGNCFSEELSAIGAFLLAMIIRWIEKSRNRKKTAAKISKVFNISKNEATEIVDKNIKEV